MATTILESPPFATLDDKFPRKTWFEMIVRKFTNYRHQVYLKSGEGQQSIGSGSTTLTIKKFNPLVKFSSLITGRQLFAKDHHDTLRSGGPETKGLSLHSRRTDDDTPDRHLQRPPTSSVQRVPLTARGRGDLRLGHQQLPAVATASSGLNFRGDH
ncbi:hypothetical protein B0H17DRAFT_1135845 [Mycena rosella]|uniref:Uncharacterized protein n=1 Tax=Mycena rosella TaxID=1033263 RepID=A0AAD7DCB4_MYCRO|nr:hypothetical protein B0H17DRAFT_1135845 [Mycena rosella]